MSEVISHHRLMVVGARPGDAQKQVFAPYDRSVIATVDATNGDAVEAALTTAHKLFRSRDSWLSKPKRIEILSRAAEIMKGQIEQLAVDAAREGGKPLIDSRIETIRAISSVEACVEELKHAAGEIIPMNVNAASANRFAATTLEPIGVVVAVSAFNHPLNLIAHQVAPAVATGCPVIVKPSEDTPLSCIRFVEILREAGLPEEWCQVTVTESRDVATALVTDPRVGFFSFIGSPGVGWSLRSQLAPGSRCALEHGGAAPVIVGPDADLSEIVPPLLKGGMYHAGQVCVSVQRIFAHESLARTLAEALADGAEKLIVGDPTRADTEVGPLIRPREVARVHEWVTEASDRGAEILSGGEPMDHNCYGPTVLYDPPDDVRMSRQEVFGPVICVYPYDDMDEAIERANSLPFAFQASVFTKDIDRAMRVYSRLDASAVMINDHTAFRVDWMPFAGLRQSGLGVGGIPHTMHDMQIQKMMVLRSPEL
ncbi:MAG: aldehyde dehydrogenase family protein [Proteobacteria bacterium]|nr:aldehyde dehydrogenase family protein [Pseudomonadota bacterium]